MSHYIRAALALALFLGVIAPAAPAQTQRPAQTIQFASVKGEGVELAGHLQRPDGAGPFLAIVLLHGCAGDWRGLDSRWGTRFVKWGYVALSVDSYGPPGSRVFAAASLWTTPRPHV